MDIRVRALRKNNKCPSWIFYILYMNFIRDPVTPPSALYQTQHSYELTDMERAGREEAMVADDSTR
jgi:hypothetical protein